MEVQFECDCGSEVSDFSRSESGEADFRLNCEDCGAVYVVTVTQLSSPN